MEKLTKKLIGKLPCDFMSNISLGLCYVPSYFGHEKPGINYEYTFLGGDNANGKLACGKGGSNDYTKSRIVAYELGKFLGALGVKVTLDMKQARPRSVGAAVM